MSEKTTNNVSIADYFAGLKSRRTKLDDINMMINWKPVEARLKKVLKRTENAVGKPAYPGLMMFKCLVLQRMYSLSDVELEEQLRDRLSFHRFVGLSITDDVPDSTTICRFRNELLGEKLSEQLFKDILSQLLTKGELKKGVIVDATVIESSRRPIKTFENVSSENEDKKDEIVLSYSDDCGASWLKKGKKLFYGYKLHMGSCPESGFILGGHITPANHSDSKELESVLKEIPSTVTGRCFADKGYSSKDNRKMLREYGFKDSIMSRASKGKALSYWERVRNKCIIPIRSGIERIFGTFKRSRQFSRSRYAGQAKVEQEFFLVALVCNLIRARNLYFL